MKRRNFFKFLGASVAAPTMIAKAVGELKKTADENVVRVSSENGDITITTPFGREYIDATVKGKGPTYVNPDYMYSLRYNEGDHVYNENGFYLFTNGKLEMIGQMFEEGRESAF